jgi:hypothetical protein
VDWIHLAPDNFQRRALVNTVLRSQKPVAGNSFYFKEAESPLLSELSASLKNKEFIDHLIKYQLLKKGL